MRKDVKFGLAIAGSLLAVLVIWIAVFDHTGQKKVTDVSLAPATQPADANQTSVLLPAPDSHVIDTSAIARTDGAATQPSVGGATVESSTARDWNQLLVSGGGATTQPAMLSATAAADPIATAPPDAITKPAPLAAARTHKVLAGETFYTMAAAAYGDSKYFSRLEDANPNVKPNRLRVGTVISIPDLNAPAAAKAGGASEAVAPTRADLDPARSYRVKSSDTLMAIARKLYGDGQAWEKIYDANKDAIGPNPARLRVDMVLRLPETPTLTAAVN